ncbi:hypothetical protein B0H19DRAFT_19948 [Mycena capillaripes]|nr:hypothetical protein B0H19DRAFT_19948 [Mycena capillaripes]
MPFFEGASNFNITGGTFNVVAGDLNRHDNYYSSYTSNAYNHYPEDIPNHQYYDRHTPWPPRGRYPAHRPSQHRHQEHGPYGYADYYDEGESDGYYDEGYEQPSAPSRFEASLQSPGHIEIAGGEFVAARNWNTTHHYHPNAPERFTHESEGADSLLCIVFVLSSRSLFDQISCRRLHKATYSRLKTLAPKKLRNLVSSQSAVARAVFCLISRVDSRSESSMVDEERPESPNSDTAVPAAIPSDVRSGTPKPLTYVERVRMAMARMDIDATDQPHAVEAPEPAPTQIPSSQGSRKSFSKVFQLGSKRKS